MEEGWLEGGVARGSSWKGRWLEGVAGKGVVGRGWLEGGGWKGLLEGVIGGGG